MLYPNYININIDNLNYNLDYLKNTYNYKYFILDVSNNAFNHGMYIVNYLNDNIDYLYTSNLNDCILIRKYNKDIPIIYSGFINNDNVFDLIMNNVILLIKDKKVLENILTLNIKDKFDIILNIDLYNYYGINSKHSILNILNLLKEHSYINILGIKSKLDEKIYEEFRQFIEPLNDLKLIILNDEEDKNKIILSNAIKFDNSFYGINNIKKNIFKKDSTDLKQIFTLYSKIVNIKKVIKNKKETYIGVMPFGYLHGLIDKIDKVFINDNLYNIKEIKDEYALIELDENIKVNDQVEIISHNNPLENYIANNTLLYFNLLNSNLPIVYHNYTLEKTFMY